MPEPKLTPREHDVAERIAAGKPYKLIADELGISVSGVRRRVESLFRKFAVDSSIGITREFVLWNVRKSGRKANGQKAN